MNEELIKKIVCPYDHNQLVFHAGHAFECEQCKRQYPINEDGIADFLPDNLRGKEWKGKPPEQRAETLAVAKTWQPGLRHWNPGVLINLLRFGEGTGRRLDAEAGMTLLDVGCGGNAQGNVNTDVYIPEPLPKNFVLATAELLPFADSSFDIVRSAYVIEHNLYPTEMLQEHLRVASKIVKTYTDNSDWLGAVALRLLNTGYIFHDEHYFKWSKEYFANILHRMGVAGKVVVFNASPSLLIKMTALLGKLPRLGPIFYRDLYVEIYKK